MEKISTYVKEHPWATGIIVVVGGFIFLMIFRGGSSSSGSGGNATGPSDAEIAANAQIQAAQIAATAQAQQAGAAVQAAQIGANVQMNSDNKAAEVYMRQIEAEQALGTTYITAQKDITAYQIDSDERVRANAIAQTGAISKKSDKGAQQVALLQSAIQGGGMGVSYSNRQPNYGNSAAGIIGSIGGLASSIGSIFSDQRLKENIRFLGYDEKGIGVYEWNYKGSKKKHIGYIAQDVARSHPEAITVDPGSGYWKVNVLELASI